MQLETMTALVKDGGQTALRRVPVPQLSAPDHLLIRVAIAGICRTDLYAAQGRIPSRDPLILGHEFSGVVEAVGTAVCNFRPGDPVTVLPWVDCGACRECAAGRTDQCLDRRMLGVDVDGGFAEWVAVPEKIVYRLPKHLPFELGAYVEPVAASAAVLKAGLSPTEPGLIYGDNRIALLTLAVLRASGFERVDLFDPTHESNTLPEARYAWAVETVASTRTLQDLIRAVRPRGRIVLKSRPCQAVELDIRAAVLKELTFCAVNYAPFEAAIALLAGGGLEVGPLLGPVYPLDQWEIAFAASTGREAAKCFLAPGTWLSTEAGSAVEAVCAG